MANEPATARATKDVADGPCTRVRACMCKQTNNLWRSLHPFRVLCFTPNGVLEGHSMLDENDCFPTAEDGGVQHSGIGIGCRFV